MNNPDIRSFEKTRPLGAGIKHAVEYLEQYIRYYTSRVRDYEGKRKCLVTDLEECDRCIAANKQSIDECKQELASIAHFVESNKKGGDLEGER